MKTPPLPAV